MDIRLAYSADSQEIDIVPNGPDLAMDHTLETAVLISLFSNRRAESDDILPDPTMDRQGWWGDEFSSVDGDLTGSRFWLLTAAKQTQETLLKYEEYAQEALQWMLDDSVASDIQIQAEYQRQNVLALAIQIYRGSQVSQQYQFLWDLLAQELLPGDENLPILGSKNYLVTEDDSNIDTENGDRLIL